MVGYVHKQNVEMNLNLFIFIYTHTYAMYLTITRTTIPVFCFGLVPVDFAHIFLNLHLLIYSIGGFGDYVLILKN